MSQENFLQQNFAARIGGSNFGKDTKIYKFEKIKRAKRAAAAENPGVELIDMGVGEPDDMAFPSVVSRLAEEEMQTENIPNREKTAEGISCPSGPATAPNPRKTQDAAGQPGAGGQLFGLIRPFSIIS